MLSLLEFESNFRKNKEGAIIAFVNIILWGWEFSLESDFPGTAGSRRAMNRVASSHMVWGVVGGFVQALSSGRFVERSVETELRRSHGGQLGHYY